MLASLVALCLALPAVAAEKKAARKDGRAKVGADQTKERRAGHGKDRTPKKDRDRKKNEKLADLDSLVATVEGISVDPNPAPEVKGTRLHRPADTGAVETQAAGTATPAPSSRSGMLDFLVVALLLSSLAAWLVRQVGPLRN